MLKVQQGECQEVSLSFGPDQWESEAAGVPVAVADDEHLDPLDSAYPAPDTDS